MDAAFVERLVAIFERSTLAELEYREGGARIRLSRSAGVSGVAVDHSAETVVVANEGPHGADEPGNILAAGIAGAFFRSPAPGAPPFVSIGDRVTEGQTLGILEAMKTLNPIEADRPGRIADILAQDGAEVEAGAPLFRIDGAA